MAPRADIQTRMTRICAGLIAHGVKGEMRGSAPYLTRAELPKELTFLSLFRVINEFFIRLNISIIQTL